MESDSSNVDVPSPEEEVKEENVKCFRLFNCDKTYKFDAVKKLLEGIKAKLSFDISIQEQYFDLPNMSEVCDRINKKELQMDFAIFVVHAHESRLSINEDNAGIGYAKLYRALLQATEERVLIVIGGDDNYKDSAEEQSTVLSRWARRKVCSQFNDEFLDGRKSFIFSWEKEHRPIHEEAMLHFFDNKGETFVPKPKDEATVAPEDPETVNSQERGETDVKATKTKQNSSNIQAQTSEDTKHNKESDSSNVDVLSSEEEVKEENVKCFRLFNCDKTYKLDAVGKLLKGIKAKLSFDISIQDHYFDLRNMSEVCDRIKKKELPMDFAIFVVHAQESRLSINEDNAGIGYAKLYRALLQATEERVLIVIGGDDNYKDSAEKQSTVLSRWARRKVSSQFNDEFLDGRKSFIFSWDKEHRPIHEEAMLHFFDPDKKGKKFVPKPRVEATVPPENPKEVECQERSETDVKSTKSKGNPSDIQTQTPEAQKTQNKHEKEEVSMQLAVETGYVFVTEESMDTSLDNVKPEHKDLPVDDSLNKPAPARAPDVQAVDSSASSLPPSVAILYRDQTDIATIKDVFGDVLPAISPITSKDPSDLKALLDTQSVRSCFIIVEAIKMSEELYMKSHGTPYQDLLRTASNTVGGKVVVILCNKGSDISVREEDDITAGIEELLGEKGCILWQLGNNRKENVSVPSPQEQQQTEENMDVSYDSYVDVSHNDVPMEESLNKPTPACQPDFHAVDSSASSLRESIAILYRDKTDIATIKDVFGDVLPAISSITRNDPYSLKNELLAQSVKSCFIIVETLKMRQELHKKSDGVPYQDLLKTASSTVGRKVVVILCDKGSDISSSEEKAITARIEELLAEKGLIVWWKATKSSPETKRSLFSISTSRSCPDGHDGKGKKAAKKGTPAQVASPINSEELVLHTRLRHGKISNDHKDVKERLEGWTAPQKMTEDLFNNYQDIANAELLVYREIKTGNERTVVKKDITSQVSGFVESSVAGACSLGSTIGSAIGLCRSSNTPPPDNDAPPFKSETDTPSSNDDKDDLPVD